MVKRVNPKKASTILRTVPERAFSFAKNLGEYTGDIASSITDFLDKVKSTPLECIEFHLYPRPPDFERWIRETLGDDYLATQISKIDRSIKGEALRRTIQKIIEERLHELKLIAMTQVKGIGERNATKLITAGIDFIEDLAHYKSSELAQKIGISDRMAARWIHNAQQTLSMA